jgi:hypothetical protein
MLLRHHIVRGSTEYCQFLEGEAEQQFRILQQQHSERVPKISLGPNELANAQSAANAKQPGVFD